MMQINQTTDQTWIEPAEIDRYWHLDPMKTEENQEALGKSTQLLRRQRIRRAQASAAACICAP